MAPREADPTVADARLAKAHQFAEAASLLFDERSRSTSHPDAYVTNAVHAGIAAADAICIRILGKYSANAAHQEAASLLKLANPKLATHLSRLLALKTRAGYSAVTVSTADVNQARRAHLSLLEAAQDL